MRDERQGRLRRASQDFCLFRVHHSQGFDLVPVRLVPAGKDDLVIPADLCQRPKERVTRPSRGYGPPPGAGSGHRCTKSEVEKTAGELKRVTGDLGVMSGLIATNAKELAALKELGERNYFEFSVAKSKSPQRVGGVRLPLKKADLKQNRYTIELYADDKRVEKRDRHINEPVQFYVSQSRLPYEIVVNEVKKDQIVGYLATPKVQMARK
jgi:hypothetical protein